MCRMDDLDDVMKNDIGTTFRRPNWVVAVAGWERCDRGDDDKRNLVAGIGQYYVDSANLSNPFLVNMPATRSKITTL